MVVELGDSTVANSEKLLVLSLNFVITISDNSMKMMK